jgi:RND family efflux transporter MFP subunit
MSRRHLICIVALLADAMLAASPRGAAEPARQGAAEASVLVTLTKLHKGSLPQIVTAFGRVQPGPAARQIVMTPLAGIVDRVYVRIGEQIAGGAPLIRLLPSPQSAAAYAQAQTAQRTADQLVERTRAMVGQHLATRQQLAEAIKAAADARAALAALKAEGADGPQILTAPAAAVVTAIPVTAGAIVAPGAPLIDLAHTKGLVLTVGVMPAQAAAVRTGNAVRVKRLGDIEPIAGKVVLRGAALDPATGLVPVEVAIPDGSLLAGEMAQADIVTGEIAGYIVPHAAILVDDSGAPYVVQARDMVARKVTVRILASEGDRDVVDGQLDPAAALVLAGNRQLTDGMRVRGSNVPPEPAR